MLENYQNSLGSAAAHPQYELKSFLKQSGSFGWNISGIAATALACVAAFSLIGKAGASSSGSWLTCHEKSLQSNICPSLQSSGSPLHLKAMELLKLDDIQQILCTNEGGYLNQYQALNEFSKNKILIQLTEDKKFQMELDHYNKQLSPVLKKITFSSLITKYYNDEIDIARLLIEPNEKIDPIETRLLKSYNGIRLAKPGDKDLTLFIHTDHKVDHNGAFHFPKFEVKFLPFLKKISKQYPVVFALGKNIDEVLDHAHQTKKNIGNLKITYVAGHGDVNGILLGEYQEALKKTGHRDNAEFRRYRYINSNEKIEVKLPIDADGLIMLGGCSAGKGGLNNEKNLVNQIALSHLGVRVMGKTIDTYTKFQIDNIEKRQFSYVNEDTVPNTNMRWMKDISYKVIAKVTDSSLNKIGYSLFNKLVSYDPTKFVLHSFGLLKTYSTVHYLHDSEEMLETFF